MANEKDEWISALVDDELDYADLDRVMKILPQDMELRERWSRYHLIRDALHNNLAHKPIPGFAQSVSAALESEPAILAPGNIRQRIPHHWLKHGVGVAVAASVAAVAILTVQSVNQDERELTSMADARPIAQQELVRMAQPTLAAQDVMRVGQPTLQVLPVSTNQHFANRQLESYLVKHNTFSPVNLTHDVMPYARIVSHNE